MRCSSLTRLLMGGAALAVLTCALPALAAASSSTLEQALALAYQNNPALQAERARLRGEDEKVALALGNWRPSLDATASAGAAHHDSATPGSASNGGASLNPRSLGLKLTQPVFRGFRTTAGVRAAEAEVKAARAALGIVEQKTLLEAATAYLDVLREEAVLDLTRNNEEVLRRQLEATKDRFEVGEVTQTDVSQAESRLQRAAAGRIQAEGDLAVRRASFSRLMGVAPDGLKAPALKLSDIPALEELLRRAESQNPEVQQAQFLQDSAREQVAVARGSLLPEVNLVGSVTRGWDQTVAAPERQDSAQIMAEVTVPLYRAGNDYARTRAAHETATQYRLLLEEARRHTHETAVTAWQALTTARGAIASNRAAVAAADLALRGVREEAKVGTRTTLDVLDAEQELLDSRVALVRAEHDEALAILQVRAAAGELTAAGLRLEAPAYAPQKHYDEVREAWFGLGGSGEP